MATLVLGIAGKAIGASIGGTLFGMTAAAIGGSIGSFIGSVVDSYLFAQNQSVEGARLDSVKVMSSTEGTVLPQVFGRRKVPGQLIFATDFSETVSTTTQGGKGGGPTVTTTEYLYSASFAVALCEGEIGGIGRIWADGKPMDLTSVTWRTYTGSETQDQDPLLVSLLGADRTPAYRGTAYVVFEDLALADYGNRLPQLTFEVFAPLAEPDTAEGLIKAVTLIPGSGEFVYATSAISTSQDGATTFENVVTGAGGDAVEDSEAGDVLVSLDQLQALMPALESVTIVVSWFGDDLRAGHCTIKPMVAAAGGASWSVNGIDRASAAVVSQSGGTVAYGGTPSDASVVELIAELKARGLRVTLMPFVLMDIAGGNNLPDPYSDNAAAIGQPSYPWRGRITCSPAPGYAGSVDKSAVADTQIASFFGSAARTDYSVSGTDVSWNGGADWGLRRMVLHYAHLAAAAGGIESFLVGSELRGVTQVRSDTSGTYPGADALALLLEDVRELMDLGGFPKYQNIAPSPVAGTMGANASLDPRDQLGTAGAPWKVVPIPGTATANISGFSFLDTGFGDWTDAHNTGWFEAWVDVDISGLSEPEATSFDFTVQVDSNYTNVDKSLIATAWTYTQAELDNNDGSVLLGSHPGTQLAYFDQDFGGNADGYQTFAQSLPLTLPTGAAILRLRFRFPGTYFAVGYRTKLRVADVTLQTLSGAQFPQLSYAADWSEFFGHQPSDGSGDVYFNLDPVWANAECDFVGVDNYHPLSDWRDGWDHLDAAAGYQAIYERAYLQSNIEGGEGYDWFYASDADRANQVRTAITDGAYSKPWIYRFKDLRNWWLNAHYNRPSGVEDTSSTAWTPQSKPIRFTELGCPAVDRGANQPNVFVDPKSSESALPYHSRGWRDDAIQRAWIEAMLGYWTDGANNPTSAVYAGPMIDTAECAVWAWDARPFPWFPARDDVWADAPHWALGHWITGRAGSVSVAAVVRHFCRQGLPDAQIDVSGLWGAVEGYAIESLNSPRASIAPLARYFGFDAVESGGVIRFFMRGQAASATLQVDELVAAPGEPARLELIRGQASELPAVQKWAVSHSGGEYDTVQVEARRINVGATRIITEGFPFAAPPEEAERRCKAALYDLWASLDRGEIALPMSRIALDPGDVVTLQHEGVDIDLRFGEIEDGLDRSATVVRHDRDAYDMPPGVVRNANLPRRAVLGAPAVAFMDLPQLSEAHTAHRPLLAAFASPWPGQLAIWRSAGSDGFELQTTKRLPSVMGTLNADLPVGPTAVWDRGSVLDIVVSSGTLASVTETELFAGANLFAIEASTGNWELVQGRDVELVAEGHYRLTKLLRGQRGSSWAMGDPAPSGARVVQLTGAVAELPVTLSELYTAWNWRAGPASRPVSDASFSQVTATPRGEGLRCFAPTDLRLALQATTGDIDITWKRCDRAPEAESWSITVPQSEASEAYEIDILSLDGATVLRTITGLTSPTYSYDTTAQTADYGAAVSTLRLRIYQVGQLGRGHPTEATLTIKRSIP